MSNIIEILEERGFVDALSSEELRELTKEPIKVYCGFDPTADSLHIGNLIAIMGLAWFQKLGHTPVALVGGATGLIGDPSGKSHERPLLDEATIQKNLEGITQCLKAVLDFDHPTAKPVIVNNFDWYKGMGCIDFLRDIGKHFRLGPMLAKDSVKSRLNSEEGISYTEFSYQVLQGYDYLHLFDREGVKVQVGGADQWGNITAGTDLIRKTRGESAFGLTFPLLTRSDGKKFGKSASGAIWLRADRLSPYHFYQYLIGTTDEDVTKFMRLLTFMDIDEIKEWEKKMREPNYSANSAQKHLAAEVTRLVHGEEGLKEAERLTAAAAPGSAETCLDEATLEMLATDLPSVELCRNEILGRSILDTLVTAGLQKSKGEARRLLRNGGVYLNNEKVGDENLCLTSEHLIGDKFCLLGVGKKKKMVLRLES